MFSKNEMTIVGRLGKDAEVKELESGKKIVTFCVATSEYLGRDDHGNSKYSDTEWTDVKCFGSLAGKLAAKGLRKSDTVIVFGRKHTEQWDDRDGNKQRRVFCYAKDADLIYEESQK